MNGRRTSAQLNHHNKDASEGNTKVTFAEINFITIMMKQRTGDERPPAVSTKIQTHRRKIRSSLLLDINVLFLIIK